MVNSLILTVTRACNLRCSYCPTVKDGWPSLSKDDAIDAVELFSDQFGGGDIKLFGGEPLLEPEVVRETFEAARNNPGIRRVYLSTNGLGLDEGWLQYLTDHQKAVLTISMDGRPDDHRRYRRALPKLPAEQPDAYEHLMTLLPQLLETPRVVVTQTIPPGGAEHTAANFQHLLDLGFTRFNFLPGYYLHWSKEQIAALRDGLSSIGDAVRARWARNEHTYVRNLFTWAPTPFFNTGLVVDSDRTIHPSNVGLSATLDELLGKTQVGTLDNPPSPKALESKAEQVNRWLQEQLPERVWESTLAVDVELTRFCNRLYGAFGEYRRRRRSA
jgi:hypothetical protein